MTEYEEFIAGVDAIEILLSADRLVSVDSRYDTDVKVWAHAALVDMIAHLCKVQAKTLDACARLDAILLVARPKVWFLDVDERLRQESRRERHA